MRATAIAPSNLALIKYWGKRDVALNVPSTGSISVTLEGLLTTTTVEFREALEADVVRLDGRSEAADVARISRFLDLVRERAGVRLYAEVDTRNGFPTGAGLASSASGFAALALACDAALGMELGAAGLSALARRGSGSAARSFFDGYAEMRAGHAADGSDAYAVPLGGPEILPLDVLVCVTTTERKSVGSTEGMQRTERTSPYHAAWLGTTEGALDQMRDALRAGDLDRVGALAEESCLRMHASMLAASPALLYWNPVTVALIERVWALRREGARAWFSIDAGPQVKVLAAPGTGAALAEVLGAVPGVVRILRTRPGRGARVVEERP
jgi:diphosphomevalonate decarboxylase